MSNDQIRLNTRERFDDQMMDIDLIPSDGRSAHYAIASVVVRMDGMTNDAQDLVSFAERLVSRYNACTGMADPAAEIAELKRHRDDLLEALNMARDYIVCCTCGGPALVGLAQVIDELLDNTEVTK